MPRKPIGERAMTPAERTRRRWRLQMHRLQEAEDMKAALLHVMGAGSLEEARSIAEGAIDGLAEAELMRGAAEAYPSASKPSSATSAAE